MIGQTISHYKITEKLGEGGMGVVYKAEDLKLGRTVALKFLPSHLLESAEHRGRFLHEARAAASLDHPNVCTVYEIDEVEGRALLAMACLEGQTLKQKIAERPLPLQEALDIALQISQGLQAAHEKGVVHRDIKPANIMITLQGQVKIMDFGLAQLSDRTKLTATGMKLGTPAYMSAEQTEGKPADRRSDIWALGVVVYEMVSGRLPFLGEVEAAVAHAIVYSEPEPPTALRSGLPIEVDRVIGKALAKDPGDRYQHIDDMAVDLKNLQEKLKSGRSTFLRTANLGASVPATLTAGQTLSPMEALPPGAVVVRRSSQRALQGLAAVLGIALLGMFAIHFTQAPPEKPVRRFSFSPAGVVEASGRISPDGKYILYAALTDGQRSLWLRSLASEAVRELAGTAGAMGGFWSPDSSSIGFAVGGPDFELKRGPIDGGSPIRLCALPDTGPGSFEGGTWSPDGERIVFSSGSLLYEIAARGGQPQLLFDRSNSPLGASLHPYFLPSDGKVSGLVYTSEVSPSDRRLAVMNLETGKRHELGPGSRPAYSPDGHLIHGPGGSAERGLWAWPFSLATLEPAGEAFPISTVGAAATVSRDGTLAYLDEAGGAASRTLVWRSRAGEMIETIGQPQPGMQVPAVSPDGRRIVVSSTESGNQDVWVHDLIRSTKTRLTFDEGPESLPTWSPSGREIAYLVAPPPRISRKPADGTGAAVVLAESSGIASHDWSRDGKYVVYQHSNAETGTDIGYLELQPGADPRKPVTFLSTAANERVPKLSPDGRFLAYVSDESGSNEIYVRPFPDGAGKWQASASGGTQPRWRSDGKEMYYVKDNALMAVAVSTGQGFTLGPPQRLFESADLRHTLAATQYDVTADGQRFVTIAPVQQDEPAPPKIHIVLNWYEEFRDRERD